MGTIPVSVSALAAALALLPHAAHAASHLWVINELFSNPTGNVQFIEMHVPSSAANERFMMNKWVLAQVANHQFTFTENLPEGSTAFAYLLLATQDFADLPGAPVPDDIITSHFFDLIADQVKWWQYGTGDLNFAAGELPLDGLRSLNRDHTTGVNSPTNFNGETGSVNVSSGVAGTDARVRGLVLRVFDTPNTGALELMFELPEAAAARIEVLDASGRRVRQLFDGRAEGPVRLRWDGRDDLGRETASGVYWIRLEALGRAAVRKVPLIR